MMKARIIYFLLGMLMLAVAGCDSENAWDGVKTSGDPKMETRSLAPFTQIVVYNGVNVVLQKGDSCMAVLDGWTNLLPKVELTVSSDGILTIEDKNGFDFVRTLGRRTTIYLTYKEEVGNISFHSDGTLSNIDTLKPLGLTLLSEDASGSVKLTVRASGVYIGTNHRNTADITFSGTSTTSVGVTNWGNAPVNLAGLATPSIDIHHHGAADMHVNASGFINATLYSVGNIYYKGNPSITLVRKGKGDAYPAP